MGSTSAEVYHGLKPFGVILNIPTSHGEVRMVFMFANLFNCFFSCGKTTNHKIFFQDIEWVSSGAAPAIFFRQEPFFLRAFFAQTLHRNSGFSQISTDWLKGKSTGKTMVFPVKYRGFLQSFPQTISNHSNEWGYYGDMETILWPLQLYVCFLKSQHGQTFDLFPGGGVVVMSQRLEPLRYDPQNHADEFQVSSMTAKSIWCYL